MSYGIISPFKNEESGPRNRARQKVLWCTHQDFIVTDDDRHPVNLDLNEFGGRRISQSRFLVLHQHSELSQIGTPVTEFSQAINAIPIEVIMLSIKGGVMQLALDTAGTVHGGIAVPDAVDHMAPFHLPAMGCLTDHLLVLRPAYTMLMTLLVSPELLIGCKQLAMVDAATAILGDALAAVQHIARFALADLYAGQLTIFWSMQVIASGRTC